MNNWNISSFLLDQKFGKKMKVFQASQMSNKFQKISRFYSKKTCFAEN